MVQVRVAMLDVFMILLLFRVDVADASLVVVMASSKPRDDREESVEVHVSEQAIKEHGRVS
jgi:hypothetical protein